MSKALFILHDPIREMVYPAPVYDAIASKVDIYAPPQAPDVLETNPSLLQEMEYLFSSWSCPHIDAAFLDAAPKLKTVFYGAGTIKKVVSDAFWERGVRITHAADANATIVAQFTLGQIILSLKGMWGQSQQVKQDRTFTKQMGYGGLAHSTVGIIGLGMIGRHVCELLQALSVNVIAHDPYATIETAQSLDVKLVDLETLFKTSHVVSLHAPWIPETVGMITGDHLAMMLPQSTFINTARGALVREDEMLTVLRDRPDLYALLDVTYPEPPPSDSPFYDLPNVMMTPHIAGAIEMNETRQMGQMMADELASYLTDGSLRWEVTQDRLRTMA